MSFVMFLAVHSSPCEDGAFPVRIACDLWSETTGATISAFNSIVRPPKNEALSAATEKLLGITDEEVRRLGADIPASLLVAVDSASKAYRVTGFELEAARGCVAASIDRLIEQNQKNVKLRRLSETWSQPNRRWLDLSEITSKVPRDWLDVRLDIAGAKHIYARGLMKGMIERENGRPSLDPVPDGDDDWIQAGEAATRALNRIAGERDAA